MLVTGTDMDVYEEFSSVTGVELCFFKKKFKFLKFTYVLYV